MRRVTGLGPAAPLSRRTAQERFGVRIADSLRRSSFQALGTPVQTDEVAALRPNIATDRKIVHSVRRKGVRVETRCEVSRGPVIFS